MAIRYLKNNASQVSRKTVLLRLDMNEPLSDKGKILDDFRIRSSIETINFLLENKCRVIIVAHLGRPNGKKDAKLSLRPVAERLAALLDAKFVESDGSIPQYPVKHLVFFTGDITSDKARYQLRNIPYKDIVLLENIRYYKGEEDNDPKLSKHLSEIADVYVNDAFGCSHRKESSLVGVSKYLPSFAGLLLQKEIGALNYIQNKSTHPYVVLMAGIKIEEKAKALEYLGKKADKVLLGGGLANLFLLARGLEIGISTADKNNLKLAKQMDKNFKGKIILPDDAVVANKSLDKSSIRVVDIYKVGKRDVIVDIGPRTILNFARHIKTAKTLVWNGPLGHFEMKPFDTGTLALAKVVGGITKGRAFGVVGGGETVDAIRLAGQSDHIDHLSTGGGAMLAYIAGETLPGIKALDK